MRGDVSFFCSSTSRSAWCALGDEDEEGKEDDEAVVADEDGDDDGEEGDDDDDMIEKECSRVMGVYISLVVSEPGIRKEFFKNKILIFFKIVRNQRFF